MLGPGDVFQLSRVLLSQILVHANVSVNLSSKRLHSTVVSPSSLVCCRKCRSTRGRCRTREMGLTWAGCACPSLFLACWSWRLLKVRHKVVLSCRSICVRPATCERFINPSSDKRCIALYTIMSSAVPMAVQILFVQQTVVQRSATRYIIPVCWTVCVQSISKRLYVCYLILGWAFSYVLLFHCVRTFANIPCRGALLSVRLGEGDCLRYLFFAFLVMVCATYIFQRSDVWRYGRLFSARIHHAVRKFRERLVTHIHTQTILYFFSDRLV